MYQLPNHFCKNRSAESAVYHLWYNPDLVVDFVHGSSKQSFRRDAEGFSFV